MMSWCDIGWTDNTNIRRWDFWASLVRPEKRLHSHTPHVPYHVRLVALVGIWQAIKQVLMRTAAYQ
jgi:hypothetical protein